MIANNWMLRTPKAQKSMKNTIESQAIDIDPTQDPQFLSFQLIQDYKSP